MDHPLRSFLLAAGLVALGIPSLAAPCPDYKAKNSYESKEVAQEALENMKRGLSRLYPTEGAVSQLPPASEGFEFTLTFRPKAGGRCPVVTDVVPQERTKSYAEAINALSLAIARAASQGGDILAVDTFVFCFGNGETRCGYSYVLIR
jgi:hypothetical protein